MKRSAHKFGGASVRDAQAIRKVGELLQAQLVEGEQAIVVVSAMGKTTNELEEVWKATEATRHKLWEDCIEKHLAVAQELGISQPQRQELLARMESCKEEALAAESKGDMSAAYDAWVASGELASTTLVAGWLKVAGISTKWWDVRTTLHTSGPHRFARVQEERLWDAGASLRATWNSSEAPQVIVTQGFIGMHPDGTTSTLGREGSDYSAALLAVATNADSVTIWKDVPGMMNADPKWHPSAVTVPRVDHSEALELSYYGASVIHPRTIKPLQQSGIPLWVKSFEDPTGPSTCIDAFPGLKPDVPMFIWREHQMWLEVFTSDGSFLAEDHLTTLFAALDSAGIHVRLMQQSATHFGLLADEDQTRLEHLQSSLGDGFRVTPSYGLVLLTMRHGNDDVMKDLTANREVRVEQRAGATWRRVLKGTT